MKLPQLKKIKLPWLSLLISTRGLYWIITIIGVAGILYFGNFLYNYFYKTITQAEEIIVLQKEVAPYNLNVVTVVEVLNGIEEKKNTQYSWSLLPNPFDTVTSAEATTTQPVTEPEP